MNNRTFQPNNWLGRDQHNVQVDKLLAFDADPFISQFVAKQNGPVKKFLLQDFNARFYPGIKDNAQLQNLISAMSLDVLRQFIWEDNFPKKIKCAIFDEYSHQRLDNCSSSGEITENYETYVDFWDDLMLHKNALVDHPRFSAFFNYFLRKVSLIYLAKLRFIASLQEKEINSLPLKALNNPNVFLKGIFQKGSSTHLNTLALDSNQYSWYRPSAVILEILKTKELNIHACSILSLLEKEQGQVKAQEELEFGQFVHLLLEDFPRWIQFSSHEDTNSILSCLYDGEHSNESIISHFRNLYLNNGLIKFYPQLSFKDEWDGLFFRIICDLEFMSLVSQIKNINFTNKVQKISHYLGPVFHSSQIGKDVFSKQMSLFAGPVVPQLQRIVLTVSEFPKNNPHFYLINKIQSQIDNLSQDGILFVFSQKKLFVPSLSEKVDALLEKIKLLASVTLEDLKGKGEIPSFLYIFTPRKNTPQSVNQLKKPALSFRISGEMPGMHFMQTIVLGIKNLFETKKVETTPLYQKELEHGITLEFYQDAIVEGQLVNSSSKDLSNITHPTFFKALTKSCIPFNHFYTFDQIGRDSNSRNESSTDTFDFIKVNSAQIQKYSSILMVDLSFGLGARLEFISPESFSAKREEHGHAYCYYFGLIPKFHNININFFKDYFQSSLGPQIIQLSLNGEVTKIKAKVGSILIPKYFLDHMPTPLNLLSDIEQLFTLKEDYPFPQLTDWKRIHGFLESFEECFQNQSTYCLMEFITFAIARLKIWERDFKNITSHSHGIYCAQFFMNHLLKLELRPIFGVENPDFYIEIFSSDHVFESCEIKSERNHQGTTYYCEIFGPDKESCAKIYAEEESLDFLAFILSAGIGVDIQTLLDSVTMPHHSDLVSLIQPVRFFQKYLSLAYTLANRPLDRILRKNLLGH